MKLTYRGVPYEANLTPVNVTGKKNIVKFRGCSYESTQAVMNVNIEPHSGIVYRGISVSQGKSARFLGNSYELKQIMLIPACVVPATV